MRSLPWNDIADICHELPNVIAEIATEGSPVGCQFSLGCMANLANNGSKNSYGIGLPPPPPQKDRLLIRNLKNLTNQM